MEDVDTFVVMLADDPERQEQVLELQRAIPGSELDEQDRGSNLDTYCLVWNAAVVHYGDVSSCVLRDGFLTLLFSPRGAEAFGVEGFRLRLELDEAERVRLREGLTVIFSEREPQEFLLE